MKDFKYKINGTPYRVVVQKYEADVVELEVNGTPYVVEIESQKRKPLAGIKRPNPSAAATASETLVTRPSKSAGNNAVVSPLPGVILDIKCNVGDSVKKGDTIAVLEAMKMENNIQATISGKVKSISVNKGDSVLEGAELIIIE